MNLVVVMCFKSGVICMGCQPPRTGTRRWLPCTDLAELDFLHINLGIFLEKYKKVQNRVYKKFLQIRVSQYQPGASVKCSGYIVLGLTDFCL